LASKSLRYRENPYPAEPHAQYYLPAKVAFGAGAFTLVPPSRPGVVGRIRRAMPGRRTLGRRLGSDQRQLLGSAHVG